MHKVLLTCCLTGGALLHPAAQAQQTTAPVAKDAAGKEAKPAADTTPSVTIAAERPTSRIDRQVYDVKSDISSSNGTAADALGNVPSVGVDPDGTVTLRGSSNVQILVDGKASAMLQGDNRGAALNAMAADDIESIEVINNPGAQFGNEGGGGPILNLVMRRNRKPGGMGSISANAGSHGRYNGAVNGSYTEGPLSYQGGISVRHDGRNSTNDVTRARLDSASGAMLPSSQSGRSTGLNDMVNANGTVSYNIDATDTVTASLAYNARGNDQSSTDRYLNLAASGAVASDYVRATQRRGDSRNYSWGARYDHKGDQPGESFKMDLRVSSSDNDNDSAYSNVYAVATGNAGNSRARQLGSQDTRIVDYTGDYEGPLAGGSVKLGYKLARNSSGSDTLYTDINPITLAESVNALRSNQYQLDETTAAVYGSYQWRVNERWGAQFGLRAEYTEMDIRQITGNVEAGNSYLNLLPSAFATYKVGDDGNLRFAYARRLRRPNAMDLNPYVTYRDEFNVSSGNPDLKPTKTDSLEVGYETRLFGLETSLRSYFRQDSDAIVDYRYFISDNVLLTTRQNGAGSESGGLEFSISGKLTPKLSLNASGNLMHMEQTSQDSNGVSYTRTANSLGGRARLNYQVDAATSVQAQVQAMGKMLSGQGYRSPNASMNLSVRHALTPRLNLVANATDIFNTNKMQTVVDSAALRETSTRRFDGRVIYIGLQYSLGGPSKSGSDEPSFGPGRGPGMGGPGMGGPGMGGPGNG